MQFVMLLMLVAFLAGAVASVSGFGIGSLLTPLLWLHLHDAKLAVAAVSIPHLIGTAVRCWMLRADINKTVLLHFGIASALGGLAGAMAHNLFDSLLLTRILGVVLIAAGLVGITRVNERALFKGPLCWVAGGLSGALGGLVGNQGGIRSAALLSFDLSKNAMVATATAIALCVDAARMPVYFYLQWQQLSAIWTLLALSTAGVLVGTFAGRQVLAKIPDRIFKQIVSGIILLLGVWLSVQ
ncbi:MAG: sulfite exporter TauE/SafE family protein [Candidatus Obscuribacterales bacterium]